MPSGFEAHVIEPAQYYTDFLHLRKFTETDETALGLTLLNPADTKKLLGHTAAWTIKIPYFGVDGHELPFSRVRLLMPTTKMKYSQARASGSHIYFPPSVNWSAILTDVNIPLIITEGEFKSWAITKEIQSTNLSAACIGLAGVTSWTDKKGLHLHSDLMQFAWVRKTNFNHISRKVYIIFDYDGAKDDGEPNDQVALAETKLAVTLRGLGAEVHLCRVGRFRTGSSKKYAIDDHLLNGGALSDVMMATSAVMNGVDTLEVKLHEFSTKYALLNGDVIRLKDGHIMPFQKAKIDSAQHVFVLTTTTPALNGGAPKVVSKELCMLEEYKKWRRRCDIKEVGIYPQYQGITVTPDGCYNYLEAWAHEPIVGSVDTYLEFCKYFFRDEPAFEEYWHNWVANIIQYPHKKNYTMPQFVSAIEGIGKSAIAEFIAEMMGLGERGPAIIAGPDQLFSSFNGVLKNKILVVVNEPSSDREDHSKQLKNMVTGKEIMINNKYGAQYVIDNHMNFVLTSNDAYITKMSNNSRREAIFRPITLTNKETHPKVVKLMLWARSTGGFGKVLNWYYERDISEYDASSAAPDTKYKQTAVDASKSPIQAFAQELTMWVTEKLDGVAAFTPAQLEVLCELWGHERRPRLQYIRKAMLAHGELELNKVIRVHGKSVRYTMFAVSDPTINCNSESRWSKYSQIATLTASAVEAEIGQ